jgi:hypothetical protein
MSTEPMADFFAPSHTNTTVTAPPATAEGRYRIAFTKVTSMILLTQQRTRPVNGTLPEIEKAYTDAQSHTLLYGWWGIPFGLIFTPLALWKNAKRMKSVRELAAAR